MRQEFSETLARCPEVGARAPSAALQKKAFTIEEQLGFRVWGSGFSVI